MIEGLNIGLVSWTNFMVYSILACLIFWVIKLGLRSSVLAKFNMVSNRIIRLIKEKMELWLPVILGLIILVLFVGVNPLIHGSILAFILILGYRPISHMLSGLAIRNESGLIINQKLEYNGHIGIIEKIGAFGVHIRSSSGLRFVNFSNLMNDGINLRSSESAMPYVKFNILSKEDGKNWTHDQLLSKLSIIPYIDWSKEFEIQILEEGNEASVAFYLKNKKYVVSLMKLIKEWGFTVTQNRKND